MIRVIRIAGESFDLETKQETSKALVLSNGIREFSLYVDDATAMAVIAMIREDKSDVCKEDGVIASEPPKSFIEGASDYVAPSYVQLAVETGTGLRDDEYNLQAEPGEEYADALTGAGSI